ncbi:MAG: alpha/beta hydrolase [Clostridia bacterium]|nr:alpha/beta hydrolase [Clostridia bacterium]
MQPIHIIFIIVGLLVLSIAGYFLSILYAAHCVHKATMRRTEKTQWARVQNDDDKEHVIMDNVGMAWCNENKEYAKDVHIINDGLNLYGEYYDYGHDRAVIILCGRPDSLRYAYFYASPYQKKGFNVLVIDARAHGESDGEFLTFGNEESRDALAWARFLHIEQGVSSIVFHGICIGSAAGLIAMTSQDCPDYIRALVTDGIYANFGESMKNHLIERKKNFFPVYRFIDFWVKHYTGHTMDKGPIDVISRMHRPILMLHSKTDPYSVPSYAQKIYDMCSSEEKKIVWFDNCNHSMLRFNYPEKYDNEIAAFTDKLYSEIQKI